MMNRLVWIEIRKIPFKIFSVGMVKIVKLRRQQSDCTDIQTAVKV
jgi:hypothetical protein